MSGGGKCPDKLFLGARQGGGGREASCVSASRRRSATARVLPRGGGVRLDMDLMMNTKAWGAGRKRLGGAGRKRLESARCGPDKTSKKSNPTKMSVLTR